MKKVFLFFFFFTAIGHAAQRYWMADSPGNWSLASNWSGAFKPGSADTAVFNGDHTGRCIIDEDIDIRSIWVQTTYTDTLVQNNGVKVQLRYGNSIFEGGTFLGGNDTLIIYDNGGDHNLIISGTANFTAPAMLYLGRRHGLIYSSTGIFRHNNGKVLFASDLNTTLNVDTLIPGGLHFYDVEVALGTRWLNNAGSAWVENDLVLTSGRLRKQTQGFIFVKGNITNTANFGAMIGENNGEIVYVGNGSKILSGDGLFCKLRIEATGTLTFGSDIKCCGFVYIAGNLDANRKRLTIQEPNNNTALQGGFGTDFALYDLEIDTHGRELSMWFVVTVLNNFYFTSGTINGKTPADTIKVYGDSTLTVTTYSPADLIVLLSVDLVVANPGLITAGAENVALSWNSYNIDGPNVDIFLIKGTTAVDTIVEDTPDDGSYTWSAVPEDLVTGNDYKIKVVSSANPAQEGISTSFTITGKSITITSPVSATKWAPPTGPVAWNYTGPVSNVKITLHRTSDSNFDSLVVSSTAAGTGGTGSYTWNAVPDLPAAADYFVIVEEVGHPDIADTSVTFTVLGPSISITQPNASTYWRTGTENTVTWTTVGHIYNVKIELLKNFAVDSVLAASTANTGTFSWMVPLGMAEGNDYSVRITDLGHGSVSSISPAFSIGSSVINEVPITQTSSEAVQSAYNLIISARPAGNYRIILLPGEYDFSSRNTIECTPFHRDSSYSITFTCADSLKGNLAQRPVLKAIYNAPAFHIRARNITIEDMEIVTDHYGVKIGEENSNYPARTTIVRRCYIHPPEESNMKGGILIEKDSACLSDSALLVNNLIADADSSGICVRNFFTSPYAYLRIINNTILMNSACDAGYGLWFSGLLDGGAVIQNNILYNAPSAGIFESGGGTSYSVVKCLFYGSTAGAGVLNGNFSSLDTLFRDPVLAAASSKYFRPGYLITGSPAINAGEVAGSPGEDLRHQTRSSPDIGAFEYTDETYCDTVFVSLQNGDNRNRGNKTSQPLKGIAYAFANRVPSPLWYPLVLKIMQGQYLEASDSHWGILLTGKDIRSNGSVRVESFDDYPPNRPVLVPQADSASVVIKGANITFEGIKVHSKGGTGVLIDNGSENVKVQRCFIRPYSAGSVFRSCVEIHAQVKKVKIENCLLDYVGSNGAIYLNDNNSSANGTIDSIVTVYNSLFLENGSGAAGIKANPYGSGSNIGNLTIMYNIFDSPSAAAVVNINPASPFAGTSKIKTNCIYNSPVATGTGGTTDTTGNLLQNPKFAVTSLENPDFLRLDSTSWCINTAGLNTDGLSSGIDYDSIARPQKGLGFDIGAYESYRSLVDTSTPANLIVLEGRSPNDSTLIVTFRNLNAYTTRKVDTLGLWWNLGSAPVFDLFATARKFYSLSLLQQLGGDSYSDTLTGNFIAGAEYYLAASARGINKKWAPFDGQRIINITIYLDLEPPPPLLQLNASVVDYSHIRLSWTSIDTMPQQAEADTVGIWMSTTFYPDSVTTLNAVPVLFNSFSETGDTILSGFSHSTVYYFSIFIRDRAGNWSVWRDYVSDSAKTWEAEDSIPPPNHLTLSLDTLSSTSVLVSWTSSTPFEQNAWVGINYDTAAFQKVSKDKVMKTVAAANLLASSGQDTLKNLRSLTEYSVCLGVADSLYNWSDSTASSCGRVRTPLGGDTRRERFFARAETLKLEYNTDSIWIGWNFTTGRGVETEVGLFEEMDTVPHAGFVALSNILHISDDWEKGNETVYLRMRIIQPTASPTQARMYRYDDLTRQWYVEYSSFLDSTGMYEIANVQKLGPAFFRVMIDTAPPLVICHNLDIRRIEGIPIFEKLVDSLTIQDQAIANPRITLSFQIGGTTENPPQILPGANGLNEIIVDDGARIYERGINASVSITDGVHDTLIDISYPVVIPTLKMPALKRGRYHFISIPLSTESGNIQEIFKDLSAAYDPFQYRLYRYRNGDYEEYQSKEGFVLEPATGYWLISKEEKPVNVGLCRTLPSKEPYRIHLRAGWTDFGIPFYYTEEGDSGIYLGDLVGRSKIEDGQFYFFGFDADSQIFVPLTDLVSGEHRMNTVLSPWRGYTVYSFTGDDTLLIPPVSMLFSEKSWSASPGKEKKILTDAWWVDVSAYWEGGCDIHNGAGTRPGARNRLPPYSPKPFAPFGDVFVHTYSGELSAKAIPVSYSFCDSLGEGHTWPFVLGNAGKKKKNVTVSFRSNGGLPLGYRCVVWNPVLKEEAMDICGDTGMTADLQEEDTLEFKLIAGTNEYVERELKKLRLPTEFALNGNYPNPFNPVTLVCFDIPYIQGDVEVGIWIYNIRGQMVRTIFTGSKPGYYRVPWAGRDHLNRPVSSGVYFVRMLARSKDKTLFLKTRKMTLLK